MQRDCRTKMMSTTAATSTSTNSAGRCRTGREGEGLGLGAPSEWACTLSGSLVGVIPDFARRLVGVPVVLTHLTSHLITASALARDADARLGPRPRLASGLALPTLSGKTLFPSSNPKTPRAQMLVFWLGSTLYQGTIPAPRASKHAHPAAQVARAPTRPVPIFKPVRVSTTRRVKHRSGGCSCQARLRLPFIPL